MTSEPAARLATSELLLIVPRALIGAGVAVMAILVPSIWPPGVVVAGIWFTAVSGIAWRRVVGLSRLAAADGWSGTGPATTVGSLTGVGEDAGSVLRRLATLAALADGIGCVAVLGLLGTTPTSPGLVLFPLLAFEVTLKYGRRGALVGAAAIAGGLASRVAMRVLGYGLPPRYNLILLVLVASGTFLALGLTVRSKDRARIGAIEEKERIAASLRATVMELLANAGRDPDPLEFAGLETLLDAACRAPEVGPELGRRLAATLSPESDSLALSKRETEVMELMADGLSDRQIASRLYLSPGTVRVHTSNAVKKLCVANRKEAVEAFGRRRKAPSPGGH
ncbi:MAG: helix-turn-helix transcriptional regulator [Acidimicrobiales bacterium]